MARRPGEPVTQAPPSRYKVVERGRRLVVIDTRTGQPATREPSAAAPIERARAKPLEAAAPSGVDRSGNAVLTTSRLYDLNGPRRIVMDERFNDVVGRAAGGWVIAALFGGTVALLFAPWLLALPFVALLQPQVRAATRQWITARLDEAGQAAS